MRKPERQGTRILDNHVTVGPKNWVVQEIHRLVTHDEPPNATGTRRLCWSH